MMADLTKLTILDLFDLCEMRNDSLSVSTVLEEIRRRYVDLAAGYESAVEELRRVEEQLEQARQAYARASEWMPT